MLLVSIVATVLLIAAVLFFIAMWVRFILDWVRVLAPAWRPKGFGVVAAEVVFTVTDPPLRAIRRVIRPIRIGGAALDFGWSIVMLGVVLLIYLLMAISAGASR